MKINFVPNVTRDADWTIDGITNSKHPPGTAAWMRNTDGQISVLSFVCPCGCRDVITVPVKNGKERPDAWVWNGSLDLPTLSPSILRKSGCKWHGWLTVGEFRTC